MSSSKMEKKKKANPEAFNTFESFTHLAHDIIAG